MSTTKEFRDYALEQMSEFNIKCRPMMGEYLLYNDDVLFGGIYDGRVLIKKTEGNKHFCLDEALPYQGAKMMYYLDIDQPQYVKEVVLATCKDLKK